MSPKKYPKRWDLNEIKYIKENAGTHTIKQLMDGLPGRQHQSIYNKMRSLKISVLPGRHKNGRPAKLRVRNTSPLWDVFNDVDAHTKGE